MMIQQNSIGGVSEAFTSAQTGLNAHWAQYRADVVHWLVRGAMMPAGSVGSLTRTTSTPGRYAAVPGFPSGGTTRDVSIIGDRFKA
jgi:hypothetical protein